MEETFSNIIRDKYKELIHHISLIGDEVKIEDRWSKLSLTIDVYKDKKRLLSFKLYKLSETDNTLEVAWGVLNRNIGHWSLPDYFDQNYMFNRLVSVITNWYQDVTNSNIDKILKPI